VSVEEPRPRVAIFAPHPLLTVTIEREGDTREQVHFHAGGQGVWVARMASHMGAEPVLCGFLGGESGELLQGLLARMDTQLRLVDTASASGCYVTDRRSGEREVLSCVVSDPPSRHELDELFSLACAEGIAAGWLVVCNPMSADALPLELYGDLVSDVRAGGARTLVDLSSPRLDSALRGEPDLVKINDWELATYVRGPVSEPAQLLAATRRLCEAGARAAIVTRGEQPALVLADEQVWWLTSPPLQRGFREGCGDAMMGALAASWARGESFEQSVRVGAAAGAANFLRHGLGSASREVVGLSRASSWSHLRKRCDRLAAQDRPWCALGHPPHACVAANGGDPREARPQAHGAPRQRGVCVAAEQVHQPLARHTQHQVPWLSVGEELGRPLDQASRAHELAQAFLEVDPRVALGVRYDRAQPPLVQPLDEHLQFAAQRSRSRLHQQPPSDTAERD
jgi:1-phosphofructokinase